MKPFVCSYHARGSEWTFDIEAESHEEAVQRLWAIKCTGRVDGEIVARGPMFPAPRRFWRWLKGGGGMTGPSWLLPAVEAYLKTFHQEGETMDEYKYSAFTSDTLSERDKADLRFDCLKLALEQERVLGKPPLEFAAELAEFVLHGTYTVKKKA